MSRYIEISKELRPCVYVPTDEPLLFHRWVYDDTALCEKKDGSIGLYHCKSIQFIDNKQKDYSFIHTIPDNVIIKQIDDLGRVQIPKQFREEMNIPDGSSIHICRDGDILKLYYRKESVNND
jgi:hypothetical protein